MDDTFDDGIDNEEFDKSSKISRISAKVWAERIVAANTKKSSDVLRGIYDAIDKAQSMPVLLKWSNEGMNNEIRAMIAADLREHGWTIAFRVESRERETFEISISESEG